ncbi:Chorismate dehydratase [bacterium HR08]|nr:Chorismate dehydratase [bacterium HR08]
MAERIERPVIAASTYLNSAPLCYSFLHGSLREAVLFLPHAAPSTCAELLRDGHVDAALIPVIEYQRIADAVIVPEVAVVSRYEVQSVFLASREPIERVRRVALDISSRTGAALTRIFFEHFMRRRVQYVPWPPDVDAMLSIADAALLIGDPALLVRYHRRDLRIYDYARLWREYTGKPLVFAFWAVREDRQEQGQRVDFHQAKVEGLRFRDRIVAHYAEVLRLPPEFLRQYLEESVTYDLDEEGLSGLMLFYDLAHRVGVVSAVRPLRFLSKLR